MGKNSLALSQDSKILVLSPHLDDMLFSSYQLLEDTRADAWTVFAGVPEDSIVTGWDRGLGFESGKDLVEARLLEDSNAFAGYEGKMKQLPFLERAYVTPEQRQRDKVELVAQIENWLAQDPEIPAYIFVPAGAGVPMPPPIWQRLKRENKAPSTPLTAPHAASAEAEPAETKAVAPSLAGRLKKKLCGVICEVLNQIQICRRRYYQSKGMLANEDHVALRDLVLNNFSNRANINLGLYDEYPYAWSRSAREWVAKNLPSATLYELPVEREKKYNRLKHYTTQTIAMDPVQKRFEQPETLPVNETYWLLGR